jgi:hypothetical protein
MAMKGGLFAVSAPPEEEDDDLEDFSGDLEELDMADEAEPASAGPFDAYAETVFDVSADPAERSDALRQAILTALEESGR